jgi:hypothetical protein
VNGWTAAVNIMMSMLFMLKLNKACFVSHAGVFFFFFFFTFLFSFWCDIEYKVQNICEIIRFFYFRTLLFHREWEWFHIQEHVLEISLIDNINKLSHTPSIVSMTLVSYFILPCSFSNVHDQSMCCPQFKHVCFTFSLTIFFLNFSYKFCFHGFD